VVISVIVVKGMDVTIVCCPIGILAVNGRLRIVDMHIYEREAAKAAEDLEALSEGKLTPSLTGLIERLMKKGYGRFIVESRDLAEALKEKFRLDVEVNEVTEAGEYVRRKLSEVAVKTGFLSEGERIEEWIREFSIELSRIRIHKSVKRRDELIIKTIQCIDDLEKTSNLLTNRLREWYGLHFPELSRLVVKNETYVQLVNSLGDRGNYNLESLVELGVQEERAEKIAKAASSSMGADLAIEDLEQIRNLSELIIGIEKAESSMEDYLEGLMEEVAPNLKRLAGTLLGARLIALAGGLTNLAKMTSSTIQVLGAEKALFRSLRTGSRPPKHGIIFQHRLVRGAKKKFRGKIARTLAAKLAIAARTDRFSGKFIADSLEEELMKRIKEIKGKG